LPLIMYYLEQKEMKEIANILEISPAGVGTRLSRARKQLRLILNKDEVLYE
jgi:DNA-directed RNA polymerase specialized sigma24 family protein